ncbi:MAG: twin transmembrane helix small protein [Acidiferrobacteraceae bacterium]
MLLIHIVIIAMLVAILVSLFSALRFMFRGNSRDPRMARALTVRVVLSLSLFILLMAAFYFGLIPGHKPP